MRRRFLALLLLTGCASPRAAEPLPRFALMSDRATVAAIAETDRRIHDVAAQGEIAVSAPGHDEVRLTGVLALRPPGEARVRAYKFGQAVFDLTITPAGVWLAADRHVQDLHVDAAQLAHGMAMLDGGLFDAPDLRLHDSGDRLIVERADGPMTLRCVIDRPTRTVRQYQLLDDRGVVRFTLTQSDFILADGFAWPSRIVADSAQGHVQITLRSVAINQGLPDGAFTPPGRAVKLP